MLVRRPEASTLGEAARAGGEFAALGVVDPQLVVNGVLMDDAGGDPVAKAYVTRQRTALAGMPVALVPLPRVDVPLVASDLTAVAALRVVTDALDDSGAGSMRTGRRPPSIGCDGRDLLDGFESPDDLVARIADEGSLGISWMRGPTSPWYNNSPATPVVTTKPATLAAATWQKRKGTHVLHVPFIAR